MATTNRVLSIYKEFSFAAAHRLPNVPDGHKCANLHGHEFRLIVGIRGPIARGMGWIMDFGDLKKVVAPVLEQLDHNYLNEVPGLLNPTSENLCSHLWDAIDAELAKVSYTEDAITRPRVCEITVYETPTSFATLKAQ